MFNPKYRFTHDEVRIIVLALVELARMRKNGQTNGLTETSQAAS
jgi:hypothetical protein